MFAWVLNAPLLMQMKKSKSRKYSANALSMVRSSTHSKLKTAENEYKDASQQENYDKDIPEKAP